MMIRIKSIKFTEHEGTIQEWRLENLSLGISNLIVGKNASGKSRILNVINYLAKMLDGSSQLPISGNYDVEFIWDDKTINYMLKYEDRKVISEKFLLDGDPLLERGNGGEGEILAESVDSGKKIKFQTPISKLAVVARQDSIQHKFLEPLHTWGSSLRHYGFGTSLGKDIWVVFGEKERKKVDEKDANAVVPLYQQAIEEFPDVFKQMVINDMELLDYPLEDIGIMAPISIRFSGMPGELVGLYVKEKNLQGITDQQSMSQGMFRALSLIIQINYSQLAKKSTCVLVDDIGEGLDFDRSCRLIDLLREKAKNFNIQLVLTTNDRFVMNRVPLEEWSVLQRNGNQVRVLNEDNSKKLFEDFKFTGLSNFSFLEMDFPSGPKIEEN